MLWQLLLAVALELALVAALIAAAFQRSMMPHLSVAVLALSAGIKRDRCAALRCNWLPVVRWQFQAVSIYHFAWRLDRACRALPAPIDALGVMPGASAVRFQHKNLHFLSKNLDFLIKNLHFIHQITGARLDPRRPVLPRYLPEETDKPRAGAAFYNK